MKPLAYLAFCRLVNSLRRIPGSPRLLLPLLFFGFVLALQMVAYFLVRSRHGGEIATASPALMPGAFVTGGPGALLATVRGVLLLSVFSGAVSALGEGNLFFAQSDVDFLFPAPLARRTVLFFRMLGRYFALLFPAAYVPLALGGALVGASANVSPLAFWPGILGSWLFLMATTNVTQTFLLRRKNPDDDEPGEAARQKRRTRLRSAASFVAVSLLCVGAYTALRALTGGSGDTARVLRVVNSQAVSVVFAPVAWASDLFRVAFDGWAWADAGRLASLIALATASFVWLFSRDHDFYESAMDLSAKQARMVRAVRGGDAGTILSQMAQDGKFSAGRDLRPFGVGARAVLWKDALAITRTPPRSWLTLAILAALPAFLGVIIGQKRTDVGVAFWMMVFTMQMSALFLLSLRDMLRRADISKALPIAPARFLLAELALSIVQLTVLGWFSLGVLLATGAGRGPLSLVAFLVLPSLATLLLLVQTVFVLLYPNQNDQAQNAVGGLLSVFASLLALLPGTLLGVLLYFAHVPPLALAAAVAGINAVCAVCALLFAAFLWQRFDPTD